jgi:precorrin-3B synthase
MSAVLKRGWCPGLFRPMESGDGWLARIRPREGVIVAPVVAALAEAAARYGNGLIEVTSRANLQIRGLRPDSIAPFIEAMLAAGAADRDEAIETRANILVSPLLGADPAISPKTAEIARALRAGLANPNFADLPAKFGFLVDGGGALPLGDLGLDITLRASGVGGWGLSWDGNTLTLDAAEAASRALSLAAEFVGRDRPGAARHAVPSRLGFVECADGPSGAVLVMPPLGQMRVEQLEALGALAQEYGDGGLRPTPWKSLAIGGVSASAATALLSGAVALGFITAPGDSRLDIATCAGAGRCSRGEIDTHEAAAWLAARRPAGAALLHISGCAKGCAHPNAAPLVLVGRAGRLDFLARGRAGDPPAIRGLTLAEVPAALAEAAV